MSSEQQPVLLSEQKRHPSAYRRKLMLLSSAAAIGVAILATGVVGYSQVSKASTASLASGTPPITVEAAQFPASFANLVAKVKPAVISVRVKVEETASAMSSNNSGSMPSFPPGSPMEKFFEQFGLPNMPDGMPQRHQMVTGEGSGFFVSPDGYAVTNNHVVAKAKSLQVTTDDGQIFPAKVIGTDPKSDLALIKVDAKKEFAYVQFADHEPRVGDWVVAVGNPFGLGGTVTAGIVSARGRDIGAGPYNDYIQIDAPINKGNSGGPAFDKDGNVIGVNTAIYSPSGGSVGIGFDIPATTAKLVVSQLKDKGYVTRGWIGVQIQPVTPGIADSLGMKKVEGAIVDQPQANSPAANAGIQAGDVITAIDGTPVKDSRDLARRIGMMAPGTTVAVDVLHKGETKTLKMTLGEMPNQRSASVAAAPVQPTDNGGHLGLVLAPAGEVAGYGGNGLVVTNVEPGSSAAEQGIKAGDVILDAGGKAVSNITDVRRALSDAKAQGKHDILMRVKSGDTTRFVAVPFDRA